MLTGIARSLHPRASLVPASLGPTHQSTSAGHSHGTEIRVCSGILDPSLCILATRSERKLYEGEATVSP